MKKLQTLFLLTIALIISANSLFADSPRMVLVEKFTNASCPPCAASAPTFHAWVKQNKTNIIPVEYHVSYPGRDIMYTNNPVPGDNRVSTYYGPAQGVPHARVDGGTNIHIAQTSQLSSAVAAHSGTSPYDITVTHKMEGTTLKVDVNLAASQAVPSNTKLRVAILQYYIKYAANEAGTNGQTEFHWVVRDMVPTPGGTDITLGAGQNTTKSFSVGQKSYWKADQMYVVAWLQNDGTKEVYQAATSLKAVETPIEVQNNFIRLDQAPGSADLVITNSSSVAATVTLKVDTENSVIPQGWTTKLAKTSVYIQPGKSETVAFTVTPNTTKGFARISVLATPVAAEYISEPSDAYVYAQSNGIEKFLLLGGSDYVGAYAQPILNHSLAQGMVISVMDPGVLENLDYSAVKVLVLPLDLSGNPGFLFAESSTNTELYSIMTRMMQNKGKIFILDEITLYFAYTPNAGGTAASRSFFTNTLGIGYAGLIQLVNDQGQLLATDLNGVANDPISHGISLNVNRDYNTTGLYAPYVEVINILDPTNVTPIFHYGTTTNVGGVKVLKDGAKAVFLGFPLYTMPASKFTTTVTKIMDWLAADAVVQKPSITVNKTTLNFGEVEIGKSQEQSITITNTGNADLVVSNVEIYFNDDNSFSSDDMPNFPKTIAPGKNFSFTVTFAPKAEKDYSTSGMTITSNDEENSSVDVVFNAIGKDASSVYENANTAEFAMQAQPNEFEESSVLSMNIGGSQTQNVEVKMIDVAGNTVMTLANGTYAPGAYSININAATLTAGKYFIIAQSGSKYYQTAVVVK